jgi:hypothetical protein
MTKSAWRRWTLCTFAVAWAAGCGGDSSSTISSDSGAESGSGDGGDDATLDGSGDGNTSDGAGDDGSSNDGPGDDSASDGGDGGGDGGAGDAPSDAPLVNDVDGGIICDGIQNNTYYVDPSNGSDSVSSTGSDQSNGNTTPQCAFKTLTHALAVVGSPSQATTILILGPSTVNVAGGEQFPFRVPAKVTIRGQGGVVTVQVPATMAVPDGGSVATSAFILAHAPSALENLTIDGMNNGSAHAVLAMTGSGQTTTLRAVDAMHFSGGAALRVEGNGVLSIEAGTHANNSMRGLHVTGNSSAIIASVTDQIQFNNNAGNNAGEGILVDSTASITVTATPGVNGNGTVVAKANVTGLAVTQDATSGVPPQVGLDGFVAWQNTSTGIAVGTQSNLHVRNSYIGANAVGVAINRATGNPNPDDVSHIDFGQSANNDPGKNTLQSLNAAKNTSIAVCVNILPNKSQTLLAFGNYWINLNGAAAIDCTTSNPGALSKGTQCSGGGDLGGQGTALNVMGTLTCTN